MKVMPTIGFTLFISLFFAVGFAGRGTAFACRSAAVLLHSSLRATAWSQQEGLTRDIRPATCGWSTPQKNLRP